MNRNGLPLLILGVAALLAVPAAAQSPVPDGEIRDVFVGKAACQPEPMPVGVGPYEFRADGVFFRKQDLASLFGRYAIANGRICITLSGPEPPDFCVDVLKDKDKGTDKVQYFFRYNGPPGHAHAIGVISDHRVSFAGSALSRQRRLPVS